MAEFSAYMTCDPTIGDSSLLSGCCAVILISFLAQLGHQAVEFTDVTSSDVVPVTWDLSWGFIICRVFKNVWNGVANVSNKLDYIMISCSIIYAFFFKSVF